LRFLTSQFLFAGQDFGLSIFLLQFADFDLFSAKGIGRRGSGFSYGFFNRLALGGWLSCGCGPFRHDRMRC
jgi:hypothetical protein